MGDKKEVQRLCTLNDVPIEMPMQGIVEGWEGIAKRMLQSFLNADILTHQRFLNILLTEELMHSEI
jgi:hypothetical protein